MSFPARLRSRPAPLGIPRAGGAEKPRTPKRRGPTAGEASFQNESGIYNNATFMGQGRGGDLAREASLLRAEQRAEQRADGGAFGLAKSIGKWIGAFAKKAPYPFIFILLLVAAATVSALLGSSAVQGTTAGRAIGSFGLGVQRHIGRLVPRPIAHPLNYFAERDIFDLQARMSNVEHTLDQLKRNINLNRGSVKRLEELVPDFVVCKKDKTGAVQIPSEFWLALKDRIQDDPSLLKPVTEEDNQRLISGHDIIVKDVQEIATNIWSNFIRHNDIKIKTLHNDTFDDLWARRLKDALRDNVLVSKSEFIEAVQKNWDDSQSLIKAEVNQLAVNVEETIQAAKQQITGLTKSELKSISETLFRTVVPRLQLEALAKANIHQNAEYSLLRFNHFSPRMGAVINPSLISPTYQPPKSPNFLSRFVFGLRPPHPAVEALTKWDETGDCWCAPSLGTRSGVQLGVLIAHDIYPDEIVVEHVPKTATLIPGNTPRQMELFALIREDALDAVGELSSSLFPDAPVEVALDGNWVRLASWEYDLDEAPVQSFPVAVNLKALRVGVSHFVVRARTNWGGDREVASSDHTCLYRVRLHGDVAY